MKPARRRSGQRGSSIIEFALVTLMLMLVILAGIEFDRMVLVYTTVANSAKIGVRYAIVHGSNRSGGTGINGQSGATDSSQVSAVIKDFASVGLLDATKLNISIQYPASASPTDPGNDIGDAVVISVSYPYDPFVALPLHVNLRSAARGIIVF